MAPPSEAEDFYRRGHALEEAGEIAQALACFDAAIAARPGYVEAYCSRGTALFRLGRFPEALADHAETVRLRPQIGALHYNQAGALEKLGRDEEALAAFHRAATLSPGDALFQYALGYRLARHRRLSAAQEALARAIRLKPDFVEALVDFAALLLEAGHPERALGFFERAHAIAPDYPYLESTRLGTRMQLCDWRGLAAGWEAMLAAILEDRAASLPFMLLAMPSRPEHQYKASCRYIRDYFPPAAAPLCQGQAQDKGKLRIAYLSASLRDHAVTFLISDIFALQDRSRFEIIGLGYRPHDGSAARTQVERGFDRFLDVSDKDDHEIARLIRSLDIDIAVDLDGHSQGSRTGVLAHRPAPLQVSFLGYPGTLGADYVDYAIADKVVIPPEHEKYYAEKIVRLPDCYQPNSHRTKAERVFNRGDCGLPPGALVFCCFNNPYKITPDIFSCWMRLLAAVEGSVLWLLDLNVTARANLVREAHAHGIDASRLVFAPHMAHAEHLARIGLADLFVDTIYYNSHTTGSDALWAGVPVLTLIGRTFASRVCASLLRTLGLDELIVHRLPDYEAKALMLARDPGALAALKAKLKDAREKSPLFDTARFARHLDRAFETMWRRHAQGQPPSGFDVEPVA